MRGILRQLVVENLSLKLISIALALLFFFMVRAEKPFLAQGTVSVAYHPPSGMLVQDTLPSTVRVAVQGGASRMQRFRFEDLAEVHIDLNQEQEGYYKFTEDLFHLPRGLKVTAIRPAGVQIRYEVLSSRTVPVSSTVQGQVASGYQILQHKVSPALVEVRGPKEVVLAIKEVSTKPVSVEGAESTLVQRVDLMPLPAKVFARPARDLTVTVEVAPFTTQVVLGQIPVDVRASDGTVVKADVSPRFVEVRVTGSAQRLAEISRKRVTAQVEAEGAGWDPLASVPKITGLPSGVKVVKVNPSKVSISLEPEKAPSTP
jgi:YbbR domain-containing protein